MRELEVLLLHLSPVLVLALVASQAVSDNTVRAPPPGCRTMCGDVYIPYPFGVSDSCSWDESFTISCNSSYSPPRPYFSNIEIIDITVETGEMRVFTAISRICYNSSKTVSDRHSWSFDFTNTPFLLSPGKNEFTGIGCHALALLRGKEDGSYFSGCVTTCTSLDEAADNGEACTGIGCCQIPTPSDLNMIKVHWLSRTTVHGSTVLAATPSLPKKDGTISARTI